MDYRARRPWERQRGESPKAYRNFCAYRDLGDERTILKAAERVKKNPSALYNQSVKWKWVERCEQYDNWLDRDRMRKLKGEIVRMRERHAGIAKVMQGKVLTSLQEMKTALKAGDIPKWVEVATKLENLARGEATEIVGASRVDRRRLNLSDLSDDELEVLERIGKRLGEGEETDVDEDAQDASEYDDEDENADS